MDAAVAVLVDIPRHLPFDEALQAGVERRVDAGGAARPLGQQRVHEVRRQPRHGEFAGRRDRPLQLAALGRVAGVARQPQGGQLRARL